MAMRACLCGMQQTHRCRNGKISVGMHMMVDATGYLGGHTCRQERSSPTPTTSNSKDNHHKYNVPGAWSPPEQTRRSKCGSMLLTVFLTKPNMHSILRFVDGATGGEWTLATTLEGHTDIVRDVKWAANIGLPFTWIASCGQDRMVMVWTQQHDNDGWKQEKLPEFPDAVWKVSWSEYGNVLAVSCADNSASLWRQEANTGKWQQISALTPPS
eukprot:TRINITY_DN103724_c0_g1_i1.p3 TRINITY_DN103724_c0_g1~~TRINITY_DN103724_c0_g1_i1.p3  ORF type:complete len:213 (-),score=29.10 TRINITY_DN103724_c0_g1_i1:127-765(-)